MKLRTHLLFANAASIAALLIILFFSYRRMLLDMTQFVWLSAAALLAGVLSFALHSLLVRPVEASVSRIAEGAGRIAAGEFRAAVPEVGPLELKELARRFNGMGAELERSFAQVVAGEAARRELVASMAHDLRTPLASVLSYVEALEDGVVDDEASFRRYLATIRSETVRLSQLIRDLFELSAFDGEALRREREDVPLDSLLVEGLPAFTQTAAARGIEIRVRIPDPSPVCRCAPRQMARVLQNLMENAVRYAPDNSDIVVEAERTENGMIVVSVSDRGPGIPEAERERVFERFYRLDRSRSRDGGGSGLGLSIARSIVEQHGGAIGVEAGEQGTGSRFWFSVPAAGAANGAGARRA